MTSFDFLQLRSGQVATSVSLGRSQDKSVPVGFRTSSFSTRGITSHLYFVGIVQQPVTDGIGKGGVTDVGMPVFNGTLAGDNSGSCLAGFMQVSSGKPETIIFWNTGVRLVCEGSRVLDHLKRLEQQGITILACTTCLEYLGLKDKMVVGKPTTMVKSIESMLLITNHLSTV